MFTGLVEEQGRVASVEQRPEGRRFWIEAVLLEGLGRLCGGRLQRGELGPRGREQLLDRRIAENGALSFEGRNAGFELLLLRGHGARG